MHIFHITVLFILPGHRHLWQAKVTLIVDDSQCCSSVSNVEIGFWIYSLMAYESLRLIERRVSRLFT